MLFTVVLYIPGTMLPRFPRCVGNANALFRFLRKREVPSKNSVIKETETY